MEYLIAIVVGVLASLLASLIFLYFLIRLKPNIEISPSISKGISKNGDTSYRIKIINKSSRPAINLRAELLIRTKRNVPNGVIVNNHSLKLKTDQMFEISKFNLSDNTAGYAKRFVCTENIEEIWNDDNSSYLLFRLIATDPVSGIQKVFKKSYYTQRTDIKAGSHHYGNSFDIS